MYELARDCQFADLAAERMKASILPPDKENKWKIINVSAGMDLLKTLRLKLYA